MSNSTNDSNTKVCRVRFSIWRGRNRPGPPLQVLHAKATARFSQRDRRSAEHRPSAVTSSRGSSPGRRRSARRGSQNRAKVRCPLQRAVPHPTMRCRKCLSVPWLRRPLRVLFGELELLRVHLRQRIMSHQWSHACCGLALCLLADSAERERLR